MTETKTNQPAPATATATPAPFAKASLSLDILIVGGGISGLAAAYALGRVGHRVTVVEAEGDGDKWLGEVGAGIQSAPNLSRILERWGLKDKLDILGVKPLSASFRRYDDDEQVGYNLIGERMAKDHGAPYYHLHRADLMGLLHDLAAPFIVSIKHDKVVSVSVSSSVSPELPDPSPNPSPIVTATLSSGETLTADIVIGADGVKSVVRQSIVDVDVVDGLRDRGDRPVPTGDLAYRALVPSAKLLADPALRSLVDVPQVTCWMGPGRHVVGYCVQGKKQYNLVMVRPDIESEESWVATAGTDEARETYKGWNSRVTKLVGFVDTALKSKLVIRPPLPTWIDKSERIVLLGDSCHAMLPYLAQGAAMAVEDAAVLGNIFSHLSDKSQIGTFLKAYQDLRLRRATGTQMASQANQRRFHLPDGPEQQARDEAMKIAMEQTLREEAGGSGVEGGLEGNSSVVTGHNKTLASLQFDYDADAAVAQWWAKELGSQVIV